MKALVSASLVVVAVIHLLPVSGALGARRLSALYGLSFDEPNLEILMRHRAVMFGLLGVFFLGAAFSAALQPMAFGAGLVSVVSFVGLAWRVGGYNGALRRVVAVDLVALACLVIGGVLRALG